MEILAYIGVALAGFLVRDVLSNWIARVAPGTPSKSQTSDPALHDLQSEIGRLRLEWQDAQDRIEHLYDRIRKRARVDSTDQPERAAATSSQQPLTPASVYAQAAAMGLTNGSRR